MFTLSAFYLWEVAAAGLELDPATPLVGAVVVWPISTPSRSYQANPSQSSLVGVLSGARVLRAERHRLEPLHMHLVVELLPSTRTWLPLVVASLVPVCLAAGVATAVYLWDRGHPMAAEGVVRVVTLAMAATVVLQQVLEVEMLVVPVPAAAVVVAAALRIWPTVALAAALVTTAQFMHRDCYLVSFLHCHVTPGTVPFSKQIDVMITSYGTGGGGVGMFGLGANGAGGAASSGANSFTGTGGSGGLPSSSIATLASAPGTTGGLYGGGGSECGIGGNGAVRVIWGISFRVFPSTGVANLGGETTV